MPPRRLLLHNHGPTWTCPPVPIVLRHIGMKHRSPDDTMSAPTEDGGMEVSDPQVWAALAVFAASSLGGMTLLASQFSRVIRAEIGGLRGELVGQIVTVRGELGGQITGQQGEVKGLIAEVKSDVAGLRVEMNTRLDSVEKKVDALDTEVANLATRFWGSQ
jgi:hypothetical protein